MSNLLTSSEKNLIAGKQHYTCANKPDSNLKFLKEYKCLLWRCNDGKFDLAGFKINLISKPSETENNILNNFCALCPSCYKIKTKNKSSYMKKKLKKDSKK